MLLGVTILLSAVATIAKAYRLAEIGHDLPVGLPEATTASDWQRPLSFRQPVTAPTRGDARLVVGCRAVMSGKAAHPP